MPRRITHAAFFCRKISDKGRCSFAIPEKNRGSEEPLLKGKNPVLFKAPPCRRMQYKTRSKQGG